MTYVRWGKSSCPSAAGTELIYAGRAAGTYYHNNGGASNYLCLPDTPQYTLRYIPGSQSYSEVHGTEYEGPVVGSHNHNVPCAVCYASTHVAVFMLPARTSCPTGWTREYYIWIYLMSAASQWNNSRTTLTKTKTHCQAAMLTPMELYSIILKPTAMVYPALHITTTKN